MTLIPSNISHREWFRFDDRAVRDPTSGDMVVTFRFSYKSIGVPSDRHWEKEEWSIQALLVSLHNEQEAREAVARLLRDVALSDVGFETGWEGARTFNFGESKELEGATLLPWIFVRAHPTSGALLVEPRADFVRYHALDRRVDGTFVHVLESLPVLDTSIERHELYDPTPHVRVHRDYLRDYLAARRAVLLVSVIGDRFANLSSDEGGQFENRDLEPLDGGTSWLTTVVHPAQDARGRTMVRATLYWNLIVEPYDRPKYRRSPWPRHFEETDEDESTPRFIADAEGRRVRLGESGCPTYLFFRSQVLEKYLVTPGYSAVFHMRNWGRAHGPRYDSGIDVGINARGLLTAFSADLERLDEQELLHWAHYTSLPVGEVCWELFQTRMMNNPPNAPGTVTILRDAREAANRGFTERFGSPLVRESELSPGDVGRLSVGPVRGDDQELCDLAVPLYEWLVPALQLAALRAPLDDAKYRYEPDAKQFGLLKPILTEVLNVPEDEARALLSPLRGANALRVAAAHRVDRDLVKVFTQMGVDTPFATTREAWNWLVDSIVGSFTRLGERFRTAT